MIAALTQPPALQALGRQNLPGSRAGKHPTGCYFFRGALLLIISTSEPFVLIPGSNTKAGNTPYGTATGTAAWRRAKDAEEGRAPTGLTAPGLHTSAGTALLLLTYRGRSPEKPFWSPSEAPLLQLVRCYPSHGHCPRDWKWDRRDQEVVGNGWGQGRCCKPAVCPGSAASQPDPRPRKGHPQPNPSCTLCTFSEQRASRGGGGLSHGPFRRPAHKYTPGWVEGERAGRGPGLGQPGAGPSLSRQRRQRGGLAAPGSTGSLWEELRQRPDPGSGNSARAAAPEPFGAAWSAARAYLSPRCHSNGSAPLRWRDAPRHVTRVSS